jgi:hypothetical protein
MQRKPRAHGADYPFTRCQHGLQAFSGRKLSAQAHETMIYGVEPVLGGICHGVSPRLPVERWMWGTESFDR